MNLNTILNALLLAFGVVYLFAVATNAEAQTSSKTLSQQLADEEEKARRGNTFQGEGILAEQALSKARQGARADVNDCPAGSVSRKPEDVQYFITSQERLQEKISKLIERFTSKSISKSQAIDDFNQFIAENNELVKWGWGKVTNGACGPAPITQLIGKSSSTTSNLISEFRLAIESNK